MRVISTQYLELNGSLMGLANQRLSWYNRVVPSYGVPHWFLGPLLFISWYPTYKFIHDASTMFEYDSMTILRSPLVAHPLIVRVSCRHHYAHDYLLVVSTFL